MYSRLTALTIVAVSTLFSSHAARAAIVTLQIDGVVEQVTDALGLLSPGVSVGSTFSGILVYDTSVADNLPADPLLGSYDQIAPSTLLITVGGYSFETTIASTFNIAVRNDASELLFQGDSIGFSANEMQGPLAFDSLGASFYLGDLGGTALSNDQLPGSINASAYSSRWIDLLGIAGGSSAGPTTLGIRLRPDSFTVVPEPASVISLSLGAGLLCLASAARVTVHALGRSEGGFWPAKWLATAVVK